MTLDPRRGSGNVQGEVLEVGCTEVAAETRDDLAVDREAVRIALQTFAEGTVVR